MVSATPIARCQTRCQVMPRPLMYNIISFVSVIRFVERRVAFVSRKSKSRTETAAPTVPGRVQRLALFGPPPLIEGEDAAAYDQLLARIYAALQPIDIIDEIFIADVVPSEWEVLRLRRLKWSLIRAAAPKALDYFLDKNLDDDLYWDDFLNDIAEILQVNLPEDQAKDARSLVRKYARNEAEAVEKIKNIFAGIGRSLKEVFDDAKDRKVKELVQEYVRREPDAVSLVDDLLTDAGMSMDSLMADVLAEKLDDIERIDRLISIAESRRNASLHELERRRTVLGETLRRSVQEIEDVEFKEIETMPAKGKNAA
jgi:hypothetical protein